jgi:hypothetical protein
MRESSIQHPASRIAGLTRRHFLTNASLGIGGAAFSNLLASDAANASARDGSATHFPHFPPRAKRSIYLFQSGGPSHLDLYDYKPTLTQQAGADLPASVRQGQRLTGFTNKQATLPVTPSKYPFQQCGQSGAWINTTLLPHIASVADDICFLKSMHTEAINHDPARTFLQTGAQLAGRPSMGTWATYGLGSENADLPAFMVLNSYGSCKRVPQPVSGRLWSAGFLPSQYQGVKLQSTGDPVLYVSSPNGVSREAQHSTINTLGQLNALKADQFQDPEITSRIRQYEMAFRMQASVPELTDLSDEPESTFKLYGEDARNRGSYAANCLLARRMAERDVRFIQLYHVGWDHHKDIPRDLPLLCKDTDQATAGLLTDLKARGLLDDTLVIWGGEFGRTCFSQGAVTDTSYGRDHHGRVFTMWMAGAGIKPGITYGESDDFGYNPAVNPVHVHDLQATILHQLGIDHTALTHKFQGREFRLTDVHGDIVHDILT